jgi:hypothetical protein
MDLRKFPSTHRFLTKVYDNKTYIGENLCRDVTK